MDVKDYWSERLRCGGIELSLSQQILSTKKAERPIDGSQNICYTPWRNDPLANVCLVRLPMRG
jgi:hypothetical protein